MTQTNTREILGSYWYPDRAGGQIGVVAALTSPGTGEWKAYIGQATGSNLEADEQLVADLGAPLLVEEASGFFPFLDPAKYKGLDKQQPPRRKIEHHDHLMVRLALLGAELLRHTPDTELVPEYAALKRRVEAELPEESK
jgi:hypothetical protein